MRWLGFAAVWVVLYGLECLLFRSFHPTWTLDLLCILVMIVANVAVVLVCRRFYPSRLLAIFCVQLLATLAVVLTISGLYDTLLGPDPRRFGFGFNFASDFVLMNLHVWPALAILARLDRRSNAIQP